MNATFGDKLRKLRTHDLHLSLRELGEILGISPGCLSQIERNLRKPPAYLNKRIDVVTPDKLKLLWGLHCDERDIRDTLAALKKIKEL